MAEILVISPTPSHPQDAGNRARIYSLLSGLKHAGHKVFFVFVRTEKGDEAAMARTWDGYFPIPYRRPRDRWVKKIYDNLSMRLGRGLVLPYRIDDWYRPEISLQLAEIRKLVTAQVVLVEYVFLSKALEEFGPEVLKVIDTHDIFGDRHRLYSQNGLTPRWFYTTVPEEGKALDRADLVLAIQDREAAYFRKHTRREVITIGHPAPVPPESPAYSGNPNRLLFVGSANPINVEAMRWFLEKVFPLIRERLPEIELEVVGECAEMLAPEPNLVLTGRVADLASCYQRARVVINPVRFGTGLKIKTVEALAFGRPLVTAPAGAAGLEGWAGKAFLLAEDAGRFAELVREAWLQEDLRTSLAIGAVEFIEKYNSETFRPLLSRITGNP